MSRLNLLFVITTLLLFPDCAFADTGVPMIFLGFPLMLVAFLPVCLLEIWYFKHALKVKTKPLVAPIFLANLMSTLIGYPLSWALLLGLNLVTTGGRSVGLSTLWTKIAAVTLQAAWLIPYEQHLNWMIPVAGMVGLIPAFFLSVWIEFLILRQFSFGVVQIQKKDVWWANVVSYAFLLFILLIVLACSTLGNRI
jgi:hypothetical protein